MQIERISINRLLTHHGRDLTVAWSYDTPVYAEVRDADGRQFTIVTIQKHSVTTSRFVNVLLDGRTNYLEVHPAVFQQLLKGKDSEEYRWAIDELRDEQEQKESAAA